MPLPKRFPDRAEIAEARAAAEPLEPGAEAETALRLAGRVLARRDLGKLVFLSTWSTAPAGSSCSARCSAPARSTSTSATSSASPEEAPGEVAPGRAFAPGRRVRAAGEEPRALPDTFHGLTDVEQRYRKRYLDLLMNEETRADFLTRSRVVAAIRRHLDADGFVEVETPVLQPRYGGAFAEPVVTHRRRAYPSTSSGSPTELPEGR